MDYPTVHIVSAHANVRDYLRGVARQASMSVRTYTDLETLLDGPGQYGLALIEDGGSSGELLKRVRKESRGHLSVALAARELCPDRIITALTAGALDYIEIPTAPADCERRLTTAARKAARIHERLQAIEEAKERVNRLSRREREVLALLCEGLANKIIARRLGISPRTVEIHRGHAMEKLDAEHAAVAVRVWLAAQADD